MRFTVHKAVAAIVGEIATVTAVVSTALADGQVTDTEMGTMASTAVIAVASVYAVWKVRNRVIATPQPAYDPTEGNHA